MKLTPRSGKRFRTRFASSRSLGSPQIPGPVMRIAPKPRRWTGRSPPREKVPLFAAFGVDMPVGFWRAAGGYHRPRSKILEGFAESPGSEVVTGGADDRATQRLSSTRM